MNSNAAGAEFVAVEDEIVALRTNFPRRGFELFEVFVHDAGERMLRAYPGFVSFAPFEKRKAGEPEKFPLRFVDDAERFAELHAKLTRNERGGFGAFNLFLCGDGDDEIACLCAASVGKLLYVFRADELLDSGSGTLRRQLYKIGSASAERFCFLSEFIELLARIACSAGRCECEDVA